VLYNRLFYCATGRKGPRAQKVKGRPIAAGTLREVGQLHFAA
jgi:hypothetical protein